MYIDQGRRSYALGDPCLTSSKYVSSSVTQQFTELETSMRLGTLKSDSMRTVPKLVLEGSPYEIGLQHGIQLKAQILSQLEFYRELFWQNCKFDWPHVRTVAEEFSLGIGKIAPDLLEEMRGIADGVASADVDLLDIIAINARSEIALGQWDDGCTALAWNLGDRQILAQNWDWHRAVGKNLALANIRQSGKPEIWMVIEPGIVGKIGFNASSVGVCLNAIRARPTATSLLPIHLLLRLALECTSVDEAIAKIEAVGGAASSQHILIADVDGARGLELSPRGGVYLKEDPEGIIVHTNHFLENKQVDEPPWLSGSPVRLDRARSLCTQLLSEFRSREDLCRNLDASLLRAKIFADTFNSPQAVCCSPDPQVPQKEVETLFNIVMIFERGKAPVAEVLFGKPDGSSDTPAVLTVMPW